MKYWPYFLFVAAVGGLATWFSAKFFTRRRRARDREEMRRQVRNYGGG